MGFFDEDTRSMLEVYLLETGQMLEHLEETLLDAEKKGIFTPEDINNIFRFMHTVKGSSAMMGLSDIAETAHSLEEIFSLLREEPDKMRGQEEALYNLLFRAADFIRGEMARMEEESFKPSPPDGLKTEIDKVLGGLRQEKAELPCPEKMAPEDSLHKKGIRVFFDPECKMEHIRAYTLIRQVRDVVPSAECFPVQPERDAGAEEAIKNDGFFIFVEEDQVGEVFGIIRQTVFVSRCEFEDQLPQGEKTEAGKAPEGGESLEAGKTPEGGESLKAGKVPEGGESLEAGKTPEADTHSKTGKEPADSQTSDTPRSRKREGEFLNVKMERLDQLQNLTEELLILFSSLQSQLNREQYVELKEQYGYAAGQLLEELSNTVTNIRMVPVTQMIPKLKRVLRDICKKEGKQIELTVTGQDVDADKNIVERLYEACLHIVRNSADHGIGSLEERERLGKPVCGMIEIHIKSSGGKMMVRVSDDGRGINEDSLRRKAREKKLYTKPEEEYTREELLELCTLPGFSTTEEATEYSGRGVGMDIVRKIAEDCGGRLWIDSEDGKGTAITMEMPLARTVMDMVRFDAGGTRFAVPSRQTVGFLEYDPQSALIRQEKEHQVILHKNRLLPVLDVAGFLGLKREEAGGTLIVLHTSSDMLCLLADEVAGEEKLVLKPVPALFGPGYQRRTGISGCSVQGDGDICLAVDGELMYQAMQREMKKRGEHGHD